MKVTLVIPTLNEILGMRAIMPRVKRELFEQILILDGGSTDGTVEYAREQGYEVHLQENRGLRLGLVEAYERVRGDVIVTFSPDGNSVPEILPGLIEKMREGYDMVIVSRYRDGARSEDDTGVTRLGNRVFTRIINRLFGGAYTDSLVLFRAYKKSLPEDLGLTLVRTDRYEKWIGRYISWEPQLSVRAAKRKLRIAEIPGDEPARILDSSQGLRGFLPPSRIHHFKSGFACLYLFAEEFLSGS